jgi:Bardet-Biedl syndrome 5 protein
MISQIYTKQSKYGNAMVVETLPMAGDYTLGFRIDPADKLQGIFDKIKTQRQASRLNPIYGIQVVHQAETTAATSTPAIAQLQRDVTKLTIVDEQQTYFAPSNAAATANAYKVGTATSGPIVYDPYLGLAVERSVGAETLEALWSGVKW